MLKCKMALTQVSFTYLQSFQRTILFPSEEIFFFKASGSFYFFPFSSCWDFFFFFFLEPELFIISHPLSARSPERHLLLAGSSEQIRV